MVNIYDMNIKKSNKKMGSPRSFTRQQALKMGYFYWLCVKNPNHLHTEISLGYLKDTKFYLESKASFIHISSIASFKPFLIAWLWEYCTFSVSSRGGSRGGVEGVATPPLRIFFCYLLDSS